MAKQYGKAELLTAMQKIEVLNVKADLLTKYADEVEVGNILRTPSEQRPAGPTETLIFLKKRV